MGGWEGGRVVVVVVVVELFRSGQLTNPLVFTKFRCEHLSKSLLFRPEPRIISLVGKFQEELNQTLSLKMSLTTFSCRS